MCHYFVTFLFASTHSPVPLTRFRILFPVFILLYDLIQGNTLTDDVFHNCHLVLFKMDFLRVTIIFPFRSFLSSILTPSILPSTPYHVSSTDHKHCVRRWYWAIFLTIATTSRLLVALEHGSRRRPAHRLNVQLAQQLQHRGVLVGSNPAHTRALANLAVLGADEYCISPLDSCFPPVQFNSPPRVGRRQAIRSKQPQDDSTSGIQQRRKTFLDHIQDVILPLLGETNVFGQQSEREVTGNFEVRPYAPIDLQPAG